MSIEEIDVKNKQLQMLTEEYCNNNGFKFYTVISKYVPQYCIFCIEIYSIDGGVCKVKIPWSKSKDIIRNGHLDVYTTICIDKYFKGGKTKKNVTCAGNDIYYAMIDYDAFDPFRKTKSRYGIKKVIFNDPATIVYWEDGSKTVVKCQEEDTFDKEKGLAMAISKRALGTNKSGSNYMKIFKKWGC